MPPNNRADAHKRGDKTFMFYVSCFPILIDSNSGRTCGAVWTFERFIDYELRGFVRETHRNVSKTDCEDFCLSESRFVHN